MNIVGEIKVSIKPVQQILKEKGLTPGGDVQAFHTSNVMRRIQKYMPYRSGIMIKSMIVATDISRPLIIIPGPYTRYMYYGEIMVDPVTGAAGFQDKNGMWKSRKGVPKVRSGRPLKYDKAKNPLAGPFWDRALMATEKSALQKDLQNYVNWKRGI